MAGLWWCNTWMDAVWSSSLKPNQKLVAAVYADHARDQRLVWVTLDRLVSRSSMSRTVAQESRRGLVAAGWLVAVQKASQHRAAVYALVIPKDVLDAQGEQSTDPASVPDTGSLRVPDNGSLATQGAGFPDSGCRISGLRVPDTGTNLSTNQSTQPQSSSGPRSFVAAACGWDEEDERLDLLDNYLADNRVQRALPWLKTCHEQGDLTRNFRDYVRQSGNPDGWMQPQRHRLPMREQRLKIARMRQKAEDGDTFAAQRIEEWQEHGHPFAPGRNDPETCRGIWDEEVNEFVANCGRPEADFAHLCHGRQEAVA